MNTLVTSIVTLLSGGLLLAVLAWVQDRRRGPIERQQADDATAKLQSEIRTADIDGLRSIIESLRAEVLSLRERVEVAETRALTAEQRAIHAESRAAEADRYIERILALWPGEHPPPPRTPFRSQLQGG